QSPWPLGRAARGGLSHPVPRQRRVVLRHWGHPDGRRRQVDHLSSSGDEQRKRYACCVAGGGPAGMMLGYLLARAGVEVLVLEKHADFLRDFRGDTIHPSTLEVMHELGSLDEF